MKYVIAISAIVIMGFATPTKAALLSFGFQIPLDVFTCSVDCDTSTTTGWIYVTLNITDPTVDMIWDEGDIQAAAVTAPVATGNPMSDVLGNSGYPFSIQGGYDYDPASGIATATLGEYAINLSSNMGYLPFDWTHLSPLVWQSFIVGVDENDPPYFYAVPQQPMEALAFVQAVPIPPAILLFASGLGILVTRRKVRNANP